MWFHAQDRRDSGDNTFATNGSVHHRSSDGREYYVSVFCCSHSSYLLIRVRVAEASRTRKKRLGRSLSGTVVL